MYFHQYATAFCFFFHATATTEIYTHLHPLALHDALPISAFMDIGTTTPILATMLGLAVGIDYTLFILARYRNELEHTDDREEAIGVRSEEHTSELQSLMRISYAVFCLKKTTAKIYYLLIYVNMNLNANASNRP